MITSDHGDLLVEFQLVSHKLVLHDALLEVPIVVRGSELLSVGDHSLAKHSDIKTTILSELGVNISEMNRTQLHEESRELAVALRGEKTRSKTFDEIRKYEPDFDHDHVPPGVVTARRSDKWKYVSNDEEASL